VVHSTQSSFKDYFSGNSSGYAQYRPHYPGDLFDFLTAASPTRKLVWDCGTGNGQAAIALAERFEHVVATDASESQIAQALAHPKVTYRVARENNSGLATQSTDLITVAQALHWFDLNAFYAECRRVLRVSGIVAVWTYERASITPEVDSIINHFDSQTVGPYWPPERKFVDEGYASLPFPFSEIPHPTFFMERELSLSDLVNYIGTWSAVKRYQAETGGNPLPQLESELKKVWKDDEPSLLVRWPMKMRVGRFDKHT